MIRIVSDSSTLYSSSEAEAAGFSLALLSVSVAGKNYREFDEISTEELVALIRQGNIPKRCSILPDTKTAKYDGHLRQGKVQ